MDRNHALPPSPVVAPETALVAAPLVRPLIDLEAEITELMGHLNAAQYRWLTLIAEFDRRNGWSDGACPSCAHWLNFKCGVALGAAREKLRVAHALEKFERVVQSFRRAKEAEELSREARQFAGRAVSYLYDDDGSLLLKARLPADVGALVLKALDVAMEDIPTPEVPAGTPKLNVFPKELPDERPSRAARRADALGALAESFLKNGGAALNGGDRHQVMVHVDAQTLRDGIAGQCEVEHGPSLSVETVRRLARDCAVVVVAEDEQGDPLNIGRRSRSIPPALRRALNTRDRGCRFHHRKVHDGGVVVEALDDGAFRFVKPDGTTYDSAAPGQTGRLSDWKLLPTVHTEAGININQCTAISRWRGERMDYGLAVDVLLAQDRRDPASSRRNVDAG